MDRNMMPHRQSVGLRILAIVPYAPNLLRIRTCRVLEQLLQHADVDLIYLDDGLPVNVPAGVGSRTAIPNASNVARVARILSGVLCGIPMAHEFYNTSRLATELKRMNTDDYDAVYVERLPLHRLPLKHRRVIYDAVDCFSHQSWMLARHVAGLRGLLYAFDSVLLPRHERRACNAANIVLTTAQREAEHLRRLGVTTAIEVWVQDQFVEAHLRVPSARDRLIVSFHGKLSYSANALALRVLNDFIAPALDPSHFELRVIGKCPPSFENKFPGLNFTGYVDSTADAISRSDLSIFPMAVSVGFSNKAMESLAAGVPFIATPVVVEGLPSMQQLMERGVYIRSIAEFPREIQRFSGLSLNEREAISRGCCAYVRSLNRSIHQSEQWKRILGWPAPGIQAQTE